MNLDEKTWINGTLSNDEDMPNSYAFEIYEVFRVVQKRPLFLKEHFARLKNSLHASNIDCHLNERQLVEGIRTIITSNNISFGNIRLSCVSTDFKTYFFTIKTSAHYYPNTQEQHWGVKVNIYELDRINPNVKKATPLIRKKIDSYLRENNLFEVLLVNSKGFVTEGSRSNFFLVKGTTIISPASSNILEGVTRKIILSQLKSIDINLTLKNISIKDLKEAEAAFISGTSIGILPISSIGGISYKMPNPTLKLLQQKYADAIALNISEFNW